MTGGVGRHGPDSSTELMVKGKDTSWTKIPNSLPARIERLASLSYNNQFFTTGKFQILKLFLCLRYVQGVPKKIVH